MGLTRLQLLLMQLQYTMFNPQVGSRCHALDPADMQGSGIFLEVPLERQST
jgi:hypothetical protein